MVTLFIGQLTNSVEEIGDGQSNAGAIIRPTKKTARENAKPQKNHSFNWGLKVKNRPQAPGHSLLFVSNVVPASAFCPFFYCYMKQQ